MCINIHASRLHNELLMFTKQFGDFNSDVYDNTIYFAQNKNIHPVIFFQIYSLVFSMIFIVITNLSL